MVSTYFWLLIGKGAMRYRYRSFITGLQFVILFVFWLILSGRYNFEYITVGVAVAAFITYLNSGLIHSVFRQGKREPIKIRHFFESAWHFLAYLPWLFFRIVMANIQVAYLVLHPRMPIKPALLQFRTQLKSNLAQVIVANSITLTPGTVTVRLEDGGYVIHTLIPSSATGIIKAQIQNKVGAFLKERKEKPPAIVWAYSIGELEE